VASEIDDLPVYRSRAAAGLRLAELEDQSVDETCIVVPVPDTAKAAADAFAHSLHIPCMEGIIRNRYFGRTFIEPEQSREASAKGKYTILPSVLHGRRVFLLEDSIVRSMTLKCLVRQMLTSGGVREVHVRVACPPVVSPCFYGIDMSTLDELFARPYVTRKTDGRLSPESLAGMATALGVCTLRYLTIADVADTIGCTADSLCLGCVTGKYPTEWGNKLLIRARANLRRGIKGRTC